MWSSPLPKTMTWKEKRASAKRAFRMEITENWLKAALESINKGADADSLTWSNSRQRAATGHVDLLMTNKIICTTVYMLNISFTSLKTEDSRLIILSKSNFRTGDFQVYKRVVLRAEEEYVSLSPKNPTQDILNVVSMSKSSSVIGSLDVMRSKISLVIENQYFFKLKRDLVHLAKFVLA